MPATYDPSTPAGQVRLLINDVGDPFTFTDDEIAAFIGLAIGGSVLRAAATALDTIASNEALVSKVIKTQDLSTNGPAVAAELRARAATLRQQADDTDDSGFGLEVIDYDPWAGVEGFELSELPWVWP